MKVGQMVQELLRFPPDANVVLSKVFVVPADATGVTEEREEAEGDFVCVVDIPLIGIANNPEDNEVRFVIGSKDAKEIYEMYGEFNIEFNKNEGEKENGTK